MLKRDRLQPMVEGDSFLILTSEKRSHILDFPIFIDSNTYQLKGILMSLSTGSKFT